MPTNIEPAADPFQLNPEPDPPMQAIMPGPEQKPAPKPAPAPVTPPLPVAAPIAPGPDDYDGDLIPDGPGSDNVSQALKARSTAYTDAAILDQLMQMEQAAKMQSGAKPQTPGQPQGTTAVTPEMGAKPQGGVASAASHATDVVYQGLVGGPRDAMQGFVDSVDWLEQSLNIPGVEITDEGGYAMPIPKFISGEELTKRKKEGKIKYGLPEVRDPSNPVSALARGITSFIAPFGLAAKAIGGVSTAATFGGRVLKGATAGGITDLLTSGTADGNLANLIQQFPALQNPVTEFLAADKDDSFAEKRIKNTLIGLGLGTGTDVGGKALINGFIIGLRAFKKGKQYLFGSDDPAKAALELSETLGEEMTARSGSELPLLGNEEIDSPIVKRLREDSKMAPALKGMQGVADEDLAKALTPKGLRPLEGNKEVYVNFARINTPEDIWRVINDTTSAFKEDITEATRGVRSNVQTKLAADDIEAWDLLMQRRQGGLLNAEQTTAARQLHATSAKAVEDIALEAHNSPTPANLFQLRRMLAVHAAIEKEMIGVRTETARALQSWSIPVGASKMRLGEIQEMLAYGGGEKVSQKIAERIVALKGIPGGRAALSRFAEKSFKAKTMGVVQEYWINALLSGPKTHIVNMMSNSTVAGISILERAVAARYGRLFQESGVEVGEAMAMVQSLRGGIRDGFRNAGKAFRTGQSGYGIAAKRLEVQRERMISSGTWNLRSDSWMGRAIDGLGAVTNIPGRMLQAEDELFKTIGYRMELSAQAQRMVAEELRSGTLAIDDAGKRFAEILDNPPEAIHLEAAANAAYQTFTNPPGNISRAVITAASRWPALKFIIPFVNTPGNIMKYAFVEHSPLAMRSKAYRDAIAKGGAEADLARTKMAMGTMAIMLAIDLGLHGHITGMGPSNKAERERWERLGNKPMSVRVGDKSLSFNRMDPLGSTLGYGAMLAEFLLNMDSSEVALKDFDELMAAAVFSAAETTTNKSYLSGLSSFVSAVDDPKRYATHFVERFATSFIPTGVGEVARIIDPVQRQTANTFDKMLAKLPGAGLNLPPRRDFWGKEITYQSGIGRIYDAVSPIYGHTYKPEPADLAFLEDRFTPGMGGQTITWERIRIPLANRPDIKSRYYELRGNTKASQLSDRLVDMYGDKTLLEALNDMVTGKGDHAAAWKDVGGDIEARHELYKKTIRHYSRAANEAVRAEYKGWFAQQAELQRAAKGFLPVAEGESEE